MNDHITKTQRAYIDLVEHLVPTVDELNDWLPTLRDVAPAQLDELRALGPRVNWSAEAYAGVFRHYVTERRHVLIEEYMAEYLSAADFTT
jgi:predicted metalloprotease